CVVKSMTDLATTPISENIIVQFFLNPTVIGCILVIVLAVILLVLLAKVSKNIIRRDNENGSKKTAVHVSYSILRFLILLCAVLLILQICGVNVTSAVAGLGIASAIVGLALQDFLKDIIMGFHILNDRFYTIGECVEYDGREGEIVELNLKTTKIRVLSDDSVITVCNRNISQIRRLSDVLEIEVPVPYGEDFDKVNKVMGQICETVAAQPPVTGCEYAGVLKLDRSAVVHRIKTICKPTDRGTALYISHSAIIKCFADNGMSVPFDQLDVHIDNPEK
ncbi:MAG: mechanosensitive ion channel family protein, partial [Oscillospiraceae bacterium]|nr:mechanosensitive ion channel family protein [Candidatus Equicaccousia limihippi]